MSNDSISTPEELQYIYSTLRRLGSIQRLGFGGGHENSKADARRAALETRSLFPRKFLLKLIDERLEDLNEFAREICDDLFKQIGGKTRTKIDPSQLAVAGRQAAAEAETQAATKSEQAHEAPLRYPEFDEYFHCCVYYLHDFIINFNWHEVDIDVVTKSDLDYVVKNLTHVNYFLQFRRTLLALLRLQDGASIKSSASGKAAKSTVAKKSAAKLPVKSPLKSNLASSPTARNKQRSASPVLRRRVRFKGTPSPPVDEEDYTSVNDRQSNGDDDERDYREVHSVFALDLLLYAINMFVQQLTDNLIDWSAQFRSQLSEFSDLLFGSREKIRSKQLESLARRIKIYNDVHLSVLDYLNEIKSRYLIHQTTGTLCALNSNRILDAYKRPRVAMHLLKIDQDVESKIMQRLIKQCLEIFLNMLVSELNLPPVELAAGTPTRTRDQQVKGQENVLNFITGWLQVDDILFGYAKPRRTIKQISNNRAELGRPKVAGKVDESSLATGGVYASSSRILAQMDNLGEFMREFVHSILLRLRDDQQTRYFIESVGLGLFEFYQNVAPKLERQLMESRKSGSKSEDPTKLVESIDLIAARIRCLKFIHIMSSAEKLMRTEAVQLNVSLPKSLIDLSARLNEFTFTCTGLKLVEQKSMSSKKDKRTS